MMTTLQRLSFYNKSWRKFSLKKFLVIVLFFVVLISFTNYAYGITVGFVPIQVAINSNTDRAYVSHADGTVHVINTNTDAVIAVIPVSPGNVLLGIAVNTATNTIYVANSGTNQVAIINGSTNTVSTTINLAPAGVFPVDVEVNTVTNTLYVSNILSLIVIVIDITPMSPFENQIIDVIPGFDSPARFAFDPNNNRMYMTNFVTNELSVLDGAQNFLAGGNPVLSPITIGTGPDGIEINTASNKVYTANSGSDTVSVIDTNTNLVIATIPVGVNPVDVGVDSANDRIYVSNKNEGTVSVINGTTDTLIKTIPADTSSLTPRLRGLAVHSGTGDVYATDSGILPGTVTVIDFAANNPPVAKAGPDQVVNEGDPVTLDGVASSDPDSDGLSFSWIKTFGPSVSLTGSSSTSTSFTAPAVNADTLFTFRLIVDDPSFSSIPDFVNVVVKDKTTFTVPGTLDSGVVSGSQSVGNIFAGSTYALQIDTPPGALPTAELEQLVIPTEVSGSGVTFNFTESSQVPSGIVEPDTETALFFDLTFGGVDFSQSSNFVSGILPKVQFLVDSAFTSAQSFADGCAVVQIELLNEISGLWEQIGNPQQANTNKIYVSNVGLGDTFGTLSVIDGSTNNVIDTITIGFAPKLVGFDQAANRIYVANQGTNTVSVIDGSTNNVIATIPVGLAPAQAVVNPNTGNVYVTNQGDGTVSVIDGSTNTAIVSTTPPIPIPTGVTPVGVDVDTDLNKIYVTNTFGSSVTVIDGATDTVIFVPPFGNIPIAQPSGIVIDSGNNRAYVSNFDDRAVSVINTNTDSIIAVIPVGSGPAGLSFNPSTSRLYVANQLSGTVSVIDTNINATVATVPTGSGPFDVAVNPNTNRAYVADRGSGTVSVIDGMPGSPTENTVIDTIAGFSNNFGIALNPAVPNPVRDPSSDVGGKCAYIAQPPHFSKFAIGGVALAVAGSGGGGGSGPPGPTVTLGALALDDNAVETISMPQEIRDIVLAHDPHTPLEPITTIFEDYELPLSINGNGFALGDYENTLVTQTIRPGEPTEFNIVFYTNSEIAHTSLYFNLGPTRTIAGSDTQVLLYKDKPAEIIDFNGNIASATGSINNEGDLKRVVTFSITFSDSIQWSNSDLVIRAWNDKLSSGDTIVYDAIEIAQPEIVEIADEDIPEPEIQTLKSQYVPNWIKNNAAWWSQELIEDSDFVAGLEYLIQNEIITIQDDQVIASYSSNEIPVWIKNNAGWWSEDLITEKEFIDGLQWLISNGIIEVTET